MNELRWTELAAHVVAWHNRHPLARRIGVQHVQSLGYVMLPFAASSAVAGTAADSPARAAPGGAQPLPPEAMTGSLRERAMARAQLDAQAQGQPLDQPAVPGQGQGIDAATPVRPAFEEDFLPPHSPRAVRRWAERQAVAQATPRGDVQVRKVATEAGLDEHLVLPRWVLTAHIEVGSARSRVLVGPGTRPAVLGRRLLSPARGGVLLALPLAGAGVVFWALSRPAAAPAPVLAQAPAAAASAERPASGGAPGHAPTPAPEPSHASASTPAAAPPAPPTPPGSAPTGMQASTERPVDVEPRLGQIALPSLGPVVDERRRRAQAAASAAATTAATTAAASAPTAGAAAHKPVAAAAPGARGAAPAAAAAPPHAGPSFAVSTRLLRTRSESEQVAAAMRELLTKQSGTAVRVEVLPAGDDWRVVGWPYADRAMADKAQALLASRGMKVQVIDF